MTELRERDLKQLSAYLDGELNPKESARLETRLKADPHLREALRDLDGTRKLLRSLPQVRPPRNFTLSPEMAGIQQRRSFYPIFRFATVVAAVALVVLVGADAFFSSGAGMMRAPEAIFETVEVAAEMEAEKLAEAPLPQEAPVEEMGEPELESAQDTLGAEEPRASVAEETVVYHAEEGEITSTEEPINEVELIPDSTTVPPSGLPPYITPTLEGWTAPTEIQPIVPSPHPTSTPALGLEPGVVQREIDPVRTVEVGLGVLTAVLAVVTIILRRQR
jgi:negative regulator of sigma E activity